MTLPTNVAIGKPANCLDDFLPRDRGRFSDSYFHKLFLSFELVNFFRENFQVALDGFFNVGECFFSVFTFTYRAGKFNALR